MELIKFLKNDRNWAYNHVSMTHCLWLSHSFVGKFVWKRQSTNRVLLVRHRERDGYVSKISKERETGTSHRVKERERRWCPTETEKYANKHTTKLLSNNTNTIIHQRSMYSHQWGTARISQFIFHVFFFQVFAILFLFSHFRMGCQYISLSIVKCPK